MFFRFVAADPICHSGQSVEVLYSYRSAERRPLLKNLIHLALRFRARRLHCWSRRAPNNKNKERQYAHSRIGGDPLMTFDQLAYFALGCFVGGSALATLLICAALISRRRRNAAAANRRGAKALRKSYP
jgi:hypothetical protein